MLSQAVELQKKVSMTVPSSVGRRAQVDLMCHETLEPLPTRMKSMHLERNEKKHVQKVLESMGPSILWKNEGRNCQGMILEDACLQLMESGFGSNAVLPRPGSQEPFVPTSTPLYNVLKSLVDLAKHHGWIVELVSMSDPLYRQDLKFQDLPWTDMEFLIEKVAQNMLQPLLVKKITVARYFFCQPKLRLACVRLPVKSCSRFSGPLPKVAPLKTAQG